MRNIRKLFVLFFIIFASNSNVMFAKDIESGIICSDMRSNGNDSRFGQNNYKKFFAPTIKITNEYIYLSKNNVKDKNIVWHDKIKNSLRSIEEAMAVRFFSVGPVTVKYMYKKRNSSLLATIDIAGSNAGAAPVIYRNCTQNSSPNVAKKKTVTTNEQSIDIETCFQDITNCTNFPKTVNNEKVLCNNKTVGVELNSKTFKTMQRNLKTLGYYKSEIDGMFGKGSCKALREYLIENTNGSYKSFSLSKFNKLHDDAKRVTQLEKKANTKEDDVLVCEKATILQNGLRRWNLDNTRAIKLVKSRGLDCKITIDNTPFNQQEAKYFLSHLMTFVSKNSSEFDLNFATEFNKVRNITSGKWNSNLSKTFELFRSYTSEFPIFQKYLEDIRLAEVEAKKIRLEQLRETAVQDMIVLREWAQKNVLDEKAAQIASLDAKFGDKDIQTINGLEQLIAETKRLFSATGIEDTVAQKQTNEIVNSLYNPSSIYLFANVSGDASNIYKNLDGEFSFEQAEGTYCASNKLDAFDYYVLQGKIFTTFNGLSKLTSRCSASTDVFVVKGNEVTSDIVFSVINLDELQQVLEVPKSERDTAFNQLNFLKETIKKDVIAGDRVGYGLLKTDSKDSSICAVIDGSEQGHVDQLEQSASLLKALSYPWNGFNKITNNAEEAFKSLQRGQCSSVYGSALTLGRLYLAGETAGINMEFMPIWVSKSAVEASQKSYDATLADSANANAELEQSIKDKEKLDKQAQQSKAKLASVRQLDLREKNGLRFMVLRDELQAQVFSAVKFAFENPADEAGYIKEYLSQSFVDQSTRYSPFDGIISDIQKLAAERWEITEQRIEQVDYGKAKFNGRELDAIEVELRIASKNRLVGKYSEYCQRIHVIKDDDFEMWRNFEIGNCDVTSATRKWKNASSFESLWIVEAK
ncbi:hypothetical protein OAD94_08235 [Amylibacter sp.]|nr:hypothetical protein [Amylibacter sp.]